MKNLMLLSLVCALAACGQKADDRRYDTPDSTYPPTTRDVTPSRDTDLDDDDMDDDLDNDDVNVRDVDNTGINERDREGTTITPGDQTETEVDRKRSADIRSRIVDGEFSANADNVKIVTVNGRVTLRGPVKSQFEKDELVRIAREIAGDGNVVDLLEIEADPR